MIFAEWSFDPGIVIPLAITALFYLIGQRAATARQRAFFWTGWAVLTLALISPLHEMGEQLFSAHMAQHEILMLIAAPLLVLSRPLVPMLHGMPFEWRRTVGRWSKTRPVRSLWKRITDPFTAWWIHAAALWIWHFPPLFDATIGNEWIHAAQHLSFFLSALLFWWSLFYARGRNPYGSGVLYVFTTAIHTGILGALLTLTTRLWYPAYANSTAAWGLTPLEDQQLGGLIMWVPASLVYIAAGLILFAAWMRASDSEGARGRYRTVETALFAIAMAALISSCGNAAGERAAMADTGGSAQAGIAAVTRYGCGSCHLIPRVPGAHGQAGPPLAGIGSRLYVAGELSNTPDNLMHWIQHPHSVNEKTLMPELGVTSEDARNIAALLYTFK
jgi:putative membrane protein